MLVVIFACKSGIYRHRSLIMFSCKHELAPVATHPCSLTGRRSNNDDQPTRLLGVISLQTKELHPSNFACSLLSPAPLARKKKGFSRDGNANSTKTAYYSQKRFAVHGWLGSTGVCIQYKSILSIYVIVHPLEIRLLTPVNVRQKA